MELLHQQLVADNEYFKKLIDLVPANFASTDIDSGDASFGMAGKQVICDLISVLFNGLYFLNFFKNVYNLYRFLSILVFCFSLYIQFYLPHGQPCKRDK